MTHQTPNESDGIGLCFISDSHDFPMVYNFSMARMRKACPKGPKILEEEVGRNIRLDGMDPFGADESVAFQLIRNMLNGENNVIRDVKVPISTRMLFYMSELGLIDGIIHKAGSLNRVPEWPLLAIVAQRCEIPGFTKQCRDVLGLFCSSGDKEVPEKLRGRLSAREWDLVKSLELMCEEVHTIRRSYMERIFEALRILCFQPTPQKFQNAMTDIDRDELNLMDTERSAMLLGMWPCSKCEGIPTGDLQRELMQMVPWFTSPGSYLGSVEVLLNLLRQAEVNIRVHKDGPDCNQLRHFCIFLLQKVTSEANTS
ncbi:hypothetical protein CDV31_004272 [Fusarium ambrosium]|uniref:Uncharacterized protein n=1 Tax=Fusarium ambrosium TaxID=131363 RepID=A0A428URQ0_9HYPO|nr:hypothetical protein CDV31_004272 [Fusarium ambrosium]